MLTFLHLRILSCLCRSAIPVQCDVFNNGVSFRRQLMHKRLEFFIFVFYRCILIDNFDKLRLQSALCIFERFELADFWRLGLFFRLTLLFQNINLLKVNSTTTSLKSLDFCE